MENGQKVEISEESYNNLAKAVQKETWNDISAWTQKRGMFHAHFGTFNILHENKLSAINKLLITAKYLNGDWKPDWYYELELKYYIEIYDGKIKIGHISGTNSEICHFKTREFAQRAIDILGEEVIKTALGDY